MVRAYIALGSNIDPDANIRRAILCLARQVRLDAVSMVYRSAALNRPEQAPYYNCVAAIDTGMPPLELKRSVLRNIENELGRIRSADKFAARTIDLDLIVYDDREMNEDGIKLPDPEILERPFLAVPLAELAPNLVLAGFGRPITQIAAGMAMHDMQPLQEYTRELQLALGQGAVESHA